MHKRREVTGQPAASKTGEAEGEYGESQLTGAETHEHKLHGNQCRSSKT